MRVVDNRVNEENIDLLVGDIIKLTKSGESTFHMVVFDPAISHKPKEYRLLNLAQGNLMVNPVSTTLDKLESGIKALFSHARIEVIKRAHASIVIE